MRQIFDRFRLPRVPDQICQQRHQLDSFVRAKFWQPNVGVDLNVAETVHDCDPLRTQMRNQRRVLFQRRVTVGIAIGVKRKTHLIRWRFLTRLGRRGRRRRCAG